MAILLKKKQNSNWRMPEMRASLFFNRRLARRLLGKHVLVGYRYLTPEGRVDHEEQIHGIVMAVDEISGVEIRKNGMVDIAVLPPDLRPWERAKNSRYTLQSTAEEISEVDYLSNWIVRADGMQTVPDGNKFRSPKSGSYYYNGFGTNLYGHNTLPDGSYIATKWITILFLPIWPLGSYRVKKIGARSVTFDLMSRGKHQSQPVFLNVRQVVTTYIISIPLWALLVFAIVSR